MWRLLHWGPLIALLIIKFVSLTTLYYFGQWSVPLWKTTSLLNLVPYCFLIFTTLYNFMSAVFDGPGYVPKGWRPAQKRDEQFLQYCYKCESFKAPRSHHCSKCNRCILKMDHHCPWINNCCGYRNQKSFFYFLLSAVIGAIHSSVLLGITMYRAIYYIPVKSILLCLFPVCYIFIFSLFLECPLQTDKTFIAWPLLYFAFIRPKYRCDNRRWRFAVYSGSNFVSKSNEYRRLDRKQG